MSGEINVPSSTGDLRITVSDTSGALVREINLGMQSPGPLEFKWDGTTDAGDGHQLANGIYYCQILAKTDSERKSKTVKIALIRSE